MNYKKVSRALLIVIAVILITVGTTYALWFAVKTQKNDNLVASACLDISIINERDDISLQQQFPISDTEGLKLTPYTFTIKNNCSTKIDYQINLESIGNEENALLASSLKVALDNKPSLLSSNQTTSATLSDAYESHILGYGTLSGKDATATHTVKMWIDYDAPNSEMNKSFASKVTVTIGQGIEGPKSLGATIIANASAGNYLYSTTPNFGVTADGEKGLYSTIDDYGTSYYFRGDTENNYVQFGTIIKQNETWVLYYDRYGMGSLEYAQNSGRGYSSEEECLDSDLYMEYNDMYGAWCVLKGTHPRKNDYFFDYEEWCGADADDPTMCENTAGPYPMLDECELDMSYYEEDFGHTITKSCYSVAVEDNNDSGETEPEELPMYWRIIRVNGDGTIRMIYDGTEKVHNGVAHTASIGENSYNQDDLAGDAPNEHPEYYSYGYSLDNQPSYLASTKVEKWYKKNLLNNYNTYIADRVFCNDVSYGEMYFEDDYEEEWRSYGSFRPYDRAMNGTATLICDSGSRSNTVSSDNGNGLLNYPIGIISSDEVIMAGGSITSNNTNYYLYSGVAYWTMSAGLYDGDMEDRDMFAVAATGKLNTYGAGANLAIRPVINLNADVAFTGNGSFDNPYVITTN